MRGGGGDLVAATVAVVGSREEREELLVVRVVVALHDELMCAHGECESVREVPARRDVLAERVAGPAW